MLLLLKQTIRRLTLLLLPLLPFHGHATEIILTPTNLDEVLQEINYLYGDLINLSEEQLKSFLNIHDGETYDPQLSAPQAHLDFVDDNLIAFSWTAVAGASNYQSGYLNLKSGDSQSTSGPENTIELAIPNGLYLFVFGASSATGIGPQWIIIEDKPLAFSQSTLLNCACKLPETIYIGPITTEPTPIFPYSAGITENPVLRVLANYGNESEIKYQASFTAKFLIDELGAIQNVVLPDAPIYNNCLQFVETDYSEIWALDYIPGAAGQTQQAIRFTFSGENMKVKALDEQYTGSVQIQRCWPVSKSGERSSAVAPRPKAKVYPNPSTGIFSLDLPSVKANPLLWTLNNQYGKALSIPTPLGHSSTWQFDLSALPDGLYFLYLANGPQTEVYPIVKRAH